MKNILYESLEKRKICNQVYFRRLDGESRNETLLETRNFLKYSFGGKDQYI